MRFPDRKPFRKPANWLVAIATEAFAPILLAHARSKTGPPTSPREWKRALIAGSCHIGDLLYRSASLEHLKGGLPDCSFYYLAAAGACETLEGNPALTKILPWLRSDSTLDIEAGHLADLRATGFDAIFCMNTGRYWPELLLALRLGIPNRVGYTHKGFSGWVTHPIPIKYPQPFAAYFRDYVASLTGQTPDWSLRPIIHASAEDEAAATGLWDALGLRKHPRVIACFMTSRQPTGIWPSSKFGETLTLLRRKTEAHILLCGAAADEALLTGVNKEFGLDADIIAGRLGIRALCCFLRRCSVVLTTDSGPRHIANAAGVPVVFVRNVWFNAVEAGAYVDTETDLCGWPNDGDRGDGAALLAAVDPGRAADAVAARMPQPRFS